MSVNLSDTSLVRGLALLQPMNVVRELRVALDRLEQLALEVGGGGLEWRHVDRQVHPFLELQQKRQRATRIRPAVDVMRDRRPETEDRQRCPSHCIRQRADDAGWALVRRRGDLQTLEECRVRGEPGERYRIGVQNLGQE